MSNMCVFGVPKEKERGNGTEEIFEDKLTK